MNNKLIDLVFTKSAIAILACFDWLPELSVSLAIHRFATGAKMVSCFETFSKDEI